MPETDLLQTETIRAALGGPDPAAQVAELARHMPPYDVASAFDELHDEERLQLLTLLPPEVAADVLTHLEPETQYHLLDRLPVERTREIVACMPSDAVVYVAAAIHPRQTEILLEWLPETYRDQVKALMVYPENTAGSLASVDYVATRESWTVEQALAHIRKVGPRVEIVSYVYVLDARGSLVGVASLRELIMAPPTARLGDVMIRQVISVPSDLDQEQAARIVAQYDLVALPVIDPSGRMVGIVTVDDLLDVIEEEATEDIQRLGGSQPLDEPYLTASFFTLFRKRIGWLLVLFLAEAVTGTVMRHFEYALMEVVALAFFIPLLIDTGGNAGSQAATLVIRAMAVGEVQPRHYARIIWRESWLGMALGAAMAVVGFARAMMLEGSPAIALTVGITLVAVVTMSSTVGTVLPLLGRRLGADPAVFSAPLITTVADGIGLIIYFEVARRILGLG